MFKINDLVVAKDEYLEGTETTQSTLSVVLEYNPESDRLVLGVLHPEKYGVPPQFVHGGQFYRHITEDERAAWVK